MMGTIRYRTIDRSTISLVIKDGDPNLAAEGLLLSHACLVITNNHGRWFRSGRARVSSLLVLFYLGRTLDGNKGGRRPGIVFVGGETDLGASLYH